MRIDTKYFVPFIIIVALIGALFIGLFTLSTQQAQRAAFRERIAAQDSLRREMMPVINGTDSLSVANFSGNFVVLDFWSTWSNFSGQSHAKLAEVVRTSPGTVKVLAAVVQDKEEKIEAYIGRNDYPFVFVKGTEVFNSYDLPGVPTQLVYGPDGELMSIFFGRAEDAQYDSLKTLIGHD